MTVMGWKVVGRMLCLMMVLGDDESGWKFRQSYYLVLYIAAGMRQRAGNERVYLLFFVK